MGAGGVGGGAAVEGEDGGEVSFARGADQGKGVGDGAGHGCDRVDDRGWRDGGQARLLEGWTTSGRE